MINSRMLFGPFGLSLAAIVVIVIALIVPIPRVLGVLRATGGTGQDNDSRMVELIAQSSERLELDRERFEGRSAFFTPERPYVAPPPRQIEDTGPPPIQPAATNYGGSLKPYAILGDQVWFATSDSSPNPTIIRLGGSAGDIRLIAINAPWTVRVAWSAPNSEEGEYDLRVFSATDSSGFRATPPAGNRLPSGMTPAPSAPSSTEPEINERAVDDVPPASDDEESRS